MKSQFFNRPACWAVSGCKIQLEVDDSVHLKLKLRQGYKF